MTTATYEMTPSGRRATLRLLAYGLWIRLGLVAAMSVVGALVTFFEGGVGFAGPLAVAVAGSAVAALSWYRAEAAIAVLEAPVKPAPAAAALLRADAPAAAQA